MRKLSFVLLTGAAVVAATATAALASGRPHPAVAHVRHFGGVVTAVGANSLTVSVQRGGPRATELVGRTLTVSVPAGTPITAGAVRQPISLAQIQVGWHVGITARQDASTGAWTAVVVHAIRTTQWFAGKVTAIGSASLTVSVLRTGAHDTQLKGTTVTVTVDGSTRIVRGPQNTPVSLGDVKVGDRVRVVVNGLTQPMTAIKIHDHA